jgi:hypothetical protein
MCNKNAKLIGAIFSALFVAMVSNVSANSSSSSLTNSITIDEINAVVNCDGPYWVDDKGLNNSQFNSFGGEFGRLHKGHDIEALDIDYDGFLYGAAGDDVDNGKPGHLYKVDGVTGELFDMGATGFDEVDGISFAPDNTLWGVAQGVGVFTIARDGHGELDLATAEVVFPTDMEIEDLTWNLFGDMLYAIENVHSGSNPDAGRDATVNHVLWGYDTHTGSLAPVCQAAVDEILGGREVEAIEDVSMFFEPDALAFGYHNNSNQLTVALINISSCAIMSIFVEEQLFQAQDVEGIAVCPFIPN